MAASSRRERALPWLIGLGFTLGWLALALLLTRDQPPAGPYLELCTWDCGWYKSIAGLGYHSTIPPVSQNGDLANVAFFPGYPLLARLIYLSVPGVADYGSRCSGWRSFSRSCFGPRSGGSCAPGGCRPRFRCSCSWPSPPIRRRFIWWWDTRSRCFSRRCCCSFSGARIRARVPPGGPPAPARS